MIESEWVEMRKSGKFDIQSNECLSTPIPKSTLLFLSISFSCFLMLFFCVNCEPTLPNPSIPPSEAFVQSYGIFFCNCDASTRGERECQSDRDGIYHKRKLWQQLSNEFQRCGMALLHRGQRRTKSIWFTSSPRRRHVFDPKA